MRELDFRFYINEMKVGAPLHGEEAQVQAQRAPVPMGGGEEDGKAVEMGWWVGERGGGFGNGHLLHACRAREGRW